MRWCIQQPNEVVISSFRRDKFDDNRQAGSNQRDRKPHLFFPLLGTGSRYCSYLPASTEEYALEQAISSAQWDEDWGYTDEDEELDEDIWNNIPPKKNQFQQLPVHREVECCPLCYTKVDTPGIPRIDHWRQAHLGQDLTISLASWVLNRSTTKEQFCTDLPPDYRVPIEGSKGKGTRYWRLETLETKARERSVGEDRV